LRLSAKFHDEFGCFAAEETDPYAIEEYPACATLKEALAHHKLDSKSSAARVLREADNK
jgi:hypothetical protein